MSQQLINAYLNELATLRRIGGTTEGVTSEAFKDLLKAWARPLGFTFIPKHAFTTTAKVFNIVDGAIMLERFPIGYWEAKDEDDDLDVEIEKKFRRGYRFADYKEKVVDLLARVVTVSVETVAITDAMAALPVGAREQKKVEA